MRGRGAHRLQPWRGDDGVVAILICLFVVFLVVPIAGISVDLSSAYANRRQMQNAADAAAEAGAQTLEAVRQGTATASSLDTTVKDVAAQNGSDTSGADYSCNVATVDYSSDPPGVTQGPSCASWTGDTTYTAVTVHTHHDVSTFFARAIVSGGATSTSATASATAAIQGVNNAYVGLSPFALCANAYTKVHGKVTVSTDPPPLLTDDLSAPIAGTSPQQYYQKLDLTAVGSNYNVWSNGGGSSDVSDCQIQSQNFDGLICGMYEPPTDPTNQCLQPITFPSGPASGAMLSITNGAVVGPTLATYAGFPACNPSDMSGSTVSFTPCGMAVPICDYGQDAGAGVPTLLHCVTFGLFYLSPGTQDSADQSCVQTPGVSQHTICGKFIGPADDVVGGTPTSGTPGVSDPVRIALVQ